MIRRAITAALAAALAWIAPASAQNRWISDDYDFVEYLIDNGLKQDARSLVFRSGYAPSDTLTFLRGWTAYQQKDLDTASGYLKAVPQASAFHDKSLFYSTAVSAHLGDFTSPVAALEAYSGPYADVKGVQLAGLALLRDDPEAFKRAAAGFGNSGFALQDAEKQLQQIFDSRYVKPQKSPLLAAAASALVPGLGKIYAGKIGEGVSGFLLTGIAAGVTAEHWVKDGPTDWKTIVPGLVCAALYIGNIYGSYVSVSIYNNNLRDVQDTAVLYNIHIPLRTVFR